MGGGSRTVRLQKDPRLVRRLLTILSAALLFFQIPLAGQNRATLSGYVKDARSGEPLIGAVIFTEDRKLGVSANEIGWYSLQAPSGDYTIKCSYAGYKVAELQVTLKGSVTQDFLLEEDRNELEAATIFSRSKQEIIALPQMGKEAVDASLVKRLPALMGEADIIRVIQMMPGVQTPSEASTGFSVRGGGIDQNLVLMDGAPLYNTGHFLGFFSMFNGDAVKVADLFKGDFPARYGGRIASVLDVSTRDGNANHFGGNVSIGLITSKIFLEGPVPHTKLSWMVSARRSYVDLFFPLFKRLPKNTAIYFWDVNGKVSWIPGPKDRVYLSVFSGHDVFGLAMPEFDLDNIRFGYRNNTASLRYHHVFGPKVSSNITLYSSRYNSDLGAEFKTARFDYRIKLFERGLKGTLNWDPNGNNHLQAGIQLSHHILYPGDLTPRETASIVVAMRLGETYGFQGAGFLENEQKIGPVTARYGFRLSHFATYGQAEQKYFDPQTHELTETKMFASGRKIKGYWGWEPRVSISVPAGTRNVMLKAAYARSYQYIQQVPTSVSGNLIDTWFTVSPNIRPQVSNQLSTGVNALFLGQALELSYEAFVKFNRGTMDYKDDPGFIIDSEDREGALRFGKSFSYGTELMLKYEFDKWSGWLSYTWSQSWYNIPEINQGKRYRSPLNHEHAVNFVLNYDIIPRLAASATWVFYSGAPTTYPVGMYYYNGEYHNIYPTRNEDTLPNYHRLDLSLTYKGKKRVLNQRWGGEWNLSLYNAYGRHNAWSMAFGYNVIDEKSEARKVWLFTCIPSVSYSLKF